MTDASRSGMVLASRLRKDPAATLLTVSGRMDVITSVWPRTMDAPWSNTLKLSFLTTHQACVPNPLLGDGRDEQTTHTQVSQTQSIVDESNQFEPILRALILDLCILALKVGDSECRSNDLHSLPPTSLIYRVKSEIKHRVNLTFYTIIQNQ